MTNKLEKFEKFLKERNNNDINAKLKDTLIITLLKAENPYLKEKRKRTQIYKALDLYLSLETKIDFFTIDTINILLKAKIIPFLLDKKELTSDMIIYGFFTKNSRRFLKWFKSVNFSKTSVKKYLGKKWGKPLTKKEFIYYKILCYFNYFNYKLEKFFFKSINPSTYFNKSIEDLNTINYSLELRKILNNIVKKARFKYRTPVISSNMLFLELLEETESYSRKLFKKLIPNVKSFLTLRYKILTEIYKTNVYIHTMIPKNRLFYIFYGQISLPEQVFQTMVSRPMRLQAYALKLRNALIKKALSYNYTKYLKYLIYNDLYSDSLEIEKKLDKVTKTKEQKKISFFDKLIYYTIKV